MGDRKAPKPPPTDQVKQAPPPAPPRKRSATVRVSVQGFFCEVRCEKCIRKALRCAACEAKVQAFTRAIKGEA